MVPRATAGEVEVGLLAWQRDNFTMARKNAVMKKGVV